MQTFCLAKHLPPLLQSYKIADMSKYISVLKLSAADLQSLQNYVIPTVNSYYTAALVKSQFRIFLPARIVYMFNNFQKDLYCDPYTETVSKVR